MMATARRGGASSPESPGSNEDGGFWKESARKEELPFDFFIGLNIPRLRSNGYFPVHRLEFLQTSARRDCNASNHGEEDMPKYVIERDIPQVGNITPDQVIAISQKSCSVLNNLGPKIQWLHSYVTQDKIYCVYIAPNEEMVREHARQGGFPANRVSEVKLIIDPTSAET
jgi:hypothetical protein